MKKTLALKSKAEIIATLIIVFLSILFGLLIMMHYAMVISNIPKAFQVILFATIAVISMAIIQFVILMLKPKIMMAYDEETLYFYKNKKSTISIRFVDIQNIYTQVSLWTKPFVVYTAIVIMTEKKTYYLRHMSKMNEIKEIIEHIAYHED